MEVTRALADPSRVRALRALRQRELCVCQIMALLGCAPSTVSKHMALLKQAGLVQSRKEGRWVYYRITDEADRSGPVSRAIPWLVDSLAGSGQIEQDSRELKRIVEMDPASLCRIGPQQEG